MNFKCKHCDATDPQKFYKRYRFTCKDCQKARWDSFPPPSPPIEIDPRAKGLFMKAMIAQNAHYDSGTLALCGNAFLEALDLHFIDGLSISAIARRLDVDRHVVETAIRHFERHGLVVKDEFRPFLDE